MSTEERLYRLGALRIPIGVTGIARLATADDRGLLAEWVELFLRERPASCKTTERAHHSATPPTGWGTGSCCGTSTAHQSAWRCCAHQHPGCRGSGRCFSPLPLRGHGYGSAVTAAAVNLAHRSGTADVVLFADLANPTSNAIYQQIGFEAVCDSVHIDFRVP
jgi:predicted GNAT family N-acyltransferase